MLLQQSAMLVCLKISSWSGSVTDKPASVSLVHQNNAARGAARVRKSLFPKEALKELNRIIAKAREAHYRLTMPWPDIGYRILTVQTHSEYVTEIDALREQIITASKDFLRNYSLFKIRAQQDLGHLYRESDYPLEGEVLDRFQIGYRLRPIPDEGNFIVDLSRKEVEKARDDMRQQIAGDLLDAQKDLYHRIDEAVTSLSEKLNSCEDGEARTIRTSLITNIQSLVDTVPKLNIFGDSNLAKICHEVKMRLANVNPDHLRPSSKAFDPLERSRVRREADDIRAKLAGMYPVIEAGNDTARAA